MFVNINNNNNNNNSKIVNFIDTTQKVIIKIIVYIKYSFIKLNCIDKNNNKFIFTINSLLLNNSSINVIIYLFNLFIQYIINYQYLKQFLKYYN